MYIYQIPNALKSTYNINLKSKQIEKLIIKFHKFKHLNQYNY